MPHDHLVPSPPLVAFGDDSRPEKKQKRQTPHVSRACDRCRKRKTRCNGGQPNCDVCLERGWQCVYEEEDKRKTNRELEDLKARVAALERLVVHPDHSGSSSGDGSKRTTGSPTPTTAVAGAPEPSPNLDHKLPHTTAVSIVGDGQTVRPSTIRANGIISPSMHSPTFVSPTSGTASNSSRPIRTLPRHNSMISQGTAADLMRTDDESYDRLQRTEDGPLIQYGATSIWTHEHLPSCGAISRTQASGPCPTRRMPGEWLDWSRHLPPGFVKDKAVHDAALDHFAAYYAPWCMTVDMPTFLQDMVLCCTVGANGEPPTESRTPFYSPLLHCAVLFLGLYLLGGEWPEKINDNHDAIMMHCMRLLGNECDVPSLSSLRGINLWSSCMNLRPAVASGSNLGYTWYAMTYGMIQVLGININCGSYVKRGRMEEQELIQRDATFWTMYLQDILRAVAVGRPPMLATINPPIPYPRIEKEVDDIPWMVPRSPHRPHNVQPPGADLNGLKGLRSTVFHWSCRLGVLLTAVMDTLYSPWSDNEIRDHAIAQLDPQLEEWFATQPIQSPSLHPIPHILVMHMAYHLTVIFLNRPFYRSGSEGLLSPADKCNRAAKSVLSLLQLFDSLHTIRSGPLTFMNIIFSASTIFLLKAVEDQCNGQDMTSSLQDIDDMISLMRRLSLTWREARRGMNILISLRSEWLPDLSSNPYGSAPPPSAAPLCSHAQGDPSSAFQLSSGPVSGLGAFAAGDTGTDTGRGNPIESSVGGFSMGEGMLNPNPPPMDLTGELHDWLMNQDFYQTMFSNVAGNGWANEGVSV